MESVTCSFLVMYKISVFLFLVQVITSALAGGASAQKLIPANIVRMMRPGSVIVDLSAEMGMFPE